MIPPDDGLKMLLAFFAFWFGACIASFLNVVIWRVPRGESVVSPPSHCPKCDAEIRWYQNIPILSWLALGGKCAKCRAPISPRYILVETLGGILFLAVFWKYFCPTPPNALNTLILWIWVALMITGSFIDFDHQLLPDFVTIGGMILGLVLGGVLSLYDGTCVPLLISIGGAALGLGLLWLVRFFGSKAFKKEAMGMGDVLLMGAVGAMFGPVAVLFTLITSSLFGTLVGLAMIACAKTRIGRFAAIPFGPYICLGCLTWMFFGPELLDLYLSIYK